MMIFNSERKFQFWHYNVSHGMLLLRSPMKGKEAENIDIVFGGVEYSELSRFLRGVVITEGTDDISPYLRNKIELDFDTDKVYEIESCDKKYFIVASSCQILRNKLELFELPFE